MDRDEFEAAPRRDGAAETFRPGEHCEVPAGRAHAELVGEEGVADVLGRRAPA